MQPILTEDNRGGIQGLQKYDTYYTCKRQIMQATIPSKCQTIGEGALEELDNSR